MTNAQQRQVTADSQRPRLGLRVRLNAAIINTHHRHLVLLTDTRITITDFIIDVYFCHKL